jgi:hypothetical protein
MRQLVYAFHVKGRATPTSPDGTALKAVTTAPDCAITSTVGPGGLTGTLEPAAEDKEPRLSPHTSSNLSSFRRSSVSSYTKEPSCDQSPH